MIDCLPLLLLLLKSRHVLEKEREKLAALRTQIKIIKCALSAQAFVSFWHCSPAAPRKKLQQIMKNDLLSQNIVSVNVIVIQRPL